MTSDMALVPFQSWFRKFGSKFFAFRAPRVDQRPPQLAQTLAFTTFRTGSTAFSMDFSRLRPGPVLNRGIVTPSRSVGVCGEIVPLISVKGKGASWAKLPKKETILEDNVVSHRSSGLPAAGDRVVGRE